MTDCTNRTHGAQLRECPFCGGEAELARNNNANANGWYVRCTRCMDFGRFLVRTRVYGTKAEAIAAWNARAAGGTLTAEQVSKAVYAHSIHADCADADWQAIADELSARAERTCRCTTDDNAWCFACSECGKTFPRSDLHYAHNHGEINFCPNCGAEVVGE